MRYKYGLAAFLLVAGLQAQTQLDLRTQGRDIDFSGALSTRPIKTGATLPTQCQTGELFYNVNASAGQNLFGCTAANTWTAQAGGGGGSATTIMFVCAATGGALNTLACTVPAGPQAYASGILAILSVDAAISGPTTLNINGLGTANVMRGNTPLAAGDLVTSRQYLLTYDGTQFQLIGAAEGVGIKYSSTDGTLATDSGIIPQYYTSAGSPAGSCVTGRDLDIDTTTGNLWDCPNTLWHNTNTGGGSGGSTVPGGAANSIQFSSSGVFGGITPNAGSTREFVVQSGNGTVAGAPILDVIRAGDLPFPTATTGGVVLSVDCSAGSQFVQKINSDGSETCATPTTGGGGVSSLSAPSAPYNPATDIWEVDDFLTGNVTVPPISRFDWLFFSGNGAVGIQNIPPAAGHPGLVQLFTDSSTTNQFAMLHTPPGFNTATNGAIALSDPWVVQFLIRPDTVDSETILRAGVAYCAGCGFGNTDFGIERIGSDTDWFARASVGGTIVRSDTGVAVSGGTWYAIQVRRINATQIGVKVAQTLGGLQGAAETVVTHGSITSQNNGNLYIALQTGSTTTSSKTLTIDYVGRGFTGLNR